MKANRKTTSSIDGLAGHQQEAVLRWLREDKVSYEEAVSRCWQDFGVRLSRSALQRWFAGREKQRVQDELLERITESSETARRVTAQFAGAPSITPALKQMLAQLAFEQAVSGNLVDPDAFCAIASLVLKAQDMDLKEQDLGLKRDKFEFDAAKACLRKLPELRAVAQDNALDQDAKVRRVREALFGVLPARST